MLALALLIPTTNAFSLSKSKRKMSGMNKIASDPSCSTSCDSLPNEQCDDVDSEGMYTLGCDLHETASCDDFKGCKSPPSPPNRPPWTKDGTYPNPPPPPFPPNHELLTMSIGLILAAVVLAVCFCICACNRYYGPGSRIGSCLWFYCGCVLCCWTRNMDEEEAARYGGDSRIKNAQRDENERKGENENDLKSPNDVPNLSGLTVSQR